VVSLVVHTANPKLEVLSVGELEMFRRIGEKCVSECSRI